jgi:LysM repeat protein
MRPIRGTWHAIVFTSILAMSAAYAEGVTVRAGDTLWTIAHTHGTTVDALIAVNGLTTDRLTPGMTLRLPDDAIVQQVADPATFETYTIKAGDTLYDIAQMHRVGVDDLIAWNDLDGTLIRPGQTLALRPRAGFEVPAELSVTVQSGQSLWQLARAHDTTVAAIASANGIDPQSPLSIGQVLTIPGRYAAVTVAGAADATPDLGGPAPATVAVGPGESLWLIARRHDTSVNALMSLNDLQSDRLQAGQLLRVVPGVDLGAARDAAFGPRPDVHGSGMVWPLVGNVTSRFGYRRLRIGGTNMHYGLDIDGNVGDPIRSATAGSVTFAGWRGGFGQLVIVTQGDAEYYYAHASAILVQEGETVVPGQVIAHVGATGNVTGPHLHFEIRVDGTAVDPLPILEARATR